MSSFTLTQPDATSANFSTQKRFPKKSMRRTNNTGFVGRNQLPTSWDTTSAHITNSKKQTFNKAMMKNAK